MSLQYHRQPLVIEKIYNVEFIDDLSAMNGLYKVIAIMGYSEIDALLEDPVELLYELAGKRTQYITDRTMYTFRNQVHYLIQQLDGQKLKLYVPESLIASVPDGNYTQMAKFLLAVEIGIFDNQDELEALSFDIQTMVRDRIGISPTALLTIFGHEYLNDDQLTAFTNARAELKATQPTLESQLYKAKTEVERLSKLVVNYEQWLTYHLKESI
jgi:hypothetical protein